MVTHHNHPIKFLLYFEWVLIAIAALVELPHFPRAEPRPLSVSLICILLFGLLGIGLPKTSPILKLLHLVASFALLFIGTIVGKIRLMTLLYVVFIIRICFILRSSTRFFVTLSIFIFVLLHQFYLIQSSHFRVPFSPRLIPLPRNRYLLGLGAPGDRAWFLAISSLILLALVAVFVQRMIDAVLAERNSRERLQVANSQLRHYALQVEDTATLQERNRIAREIHDSLGHSLTAFNLHLEAAMRLLQSDPDEAQELLKDAKQLGSKALQEVRQSVATLRLQPIQGKTLEAAIVALLEDLTRSTGIVPTAEFTIATHLNTEYQTALYRITQEALTNIIKYAQATAVSLKLTAQPTNINLIIQDNGRGFVLAQTTSGFGLQGMRERADSLGGTCNISTNPGQGCKILIHLPGLTIPE